MQSTRSARSTTQVTVGPSQVVHQSQVLQLKKEVVTTNKVVELLETMKQMDIFAPAEKEKLNAWASNASLKTFDKPQDENTKNTALEGLLFLITKVVRPTLLKQTAEDALVALFDIDERIQSIMSSYLPKGKNCEETIEDYQANEPKKIIEKPLQDTLAPSEKLNVLLEKMQSSPFFTVQEQKTIQQWKSQMPSKLLDKVDGAELSEIVSIALSYLLSKIIDPALCRAEKDAEKYALYAMSKELMVILQLSLPEKENIEDFIQSYKHFSHDEQIFKKKLIRTEISSTNANKKLYNNANATDEALITNAEQEQQQLLGLTQHKRLMAKKPNDKISALTQGMDTAITQVSQNAADLQPIANKLQGTHSQFQQRINECQEMLGTVRI